MIAKAMAWRGIDRQLAVSHVMKRLAYACRYGNTTLTEVVHLDQMFLQDFLEAVSEIVEQENGKSRA